MHYKLYINQNYTKFSAFFYIVFLQFISFVLRIDNSI